MPSKKTSQGQAWDQLALENLGNEKQMGAILPLNVDDMDTLLFSAETEIRIPEIKTAVSRSLPPWERM